MKPSGRPWPNPAWLIVTLSAVLMLAACAESGPQGRSGPGPTVIRATPEGDPRHTRLGFSVLPAQLTSEGYLEAFATAARYGDIALIQRAPPWQDFLPGATISQATKDTTSLETRLFAQYPGLARFYAIDPTDGGVQRARLAALPPGIDAAAGFADPSLKSAFLQYTAYIAKSYQPDYLAIGVEVNMLFERNPKQFEAFVALYKEAYALAKAASPKTKVFPTFQLEDLLGSFDQVHEPHWQVLDAFRGSMDALAISTYPYLGNISTAADIPADAYAQLTRHFEGEIIIAETAYASAPVEGKAVVGTDEDQRAYLVRLLAEAEKNRFTAVVWLAALDPAYGAAGPASVFKNAGLRKSDGSNKLAWDVWESWSRRPLR